MAKNSFDHCACDYAQFRPGYPDSLCADILACLPEHSRCIIDVGCGSGQLGRSLHAEHVNLVSIDASHTMLRAGAHSPAIVGHAEQLPLLPGCANVITAAQSFHWFNPPLALREFARVLASTGWLVLVWNDRCPQPGGFGERYESLVRRYNPAYHREYRQQDWTAKIESSNAFDAVERRRYPHKWTVSADHWVGHSRTVSYIRNVIAQSARQQFERDLRTLIEACYGDEAIEIPMVSNAWFAHKRTN